MARVVRRAGLGTVLRSPSRKFSPLSLVDAHRYIDAQRMMRSPDTARLVELDTDNPHSQVDRISARVEAGEIDLVVSDCVLWHPAWAHDHLRALAQAIGPDCWLLFLEPVLDVGWRERAAGLLVDRDIDRHGHAFTRDLPQDIRKAGLVVTTTVRFDIGRRLTYAWGEARHFPGLA